MVLNVGKKGLIIWTILIVIAVVCIVTLTCYLNFSINGKKITKENIHEIKFYQTIYDMTVVSNKNINTYFVKEWYKENVGNKFEYLDYMKNTFAVILNKDSCYIKNSGNKAYFVTQNIYGNKNISSMSFFLRMYNTKCNCKKEAYSKNNEDRYIIQVSKEDSCILKDILDKLKVDKLELVVKDGLPLTYTIYSSGIEYISIVYRSVDVNTVIDDSIFNVI